MKPAADPLDTQHAIKSLLDELPPEIASLLPENLPPAEQLTWLVNARVVEKKVEAQRNFKPYPFQRRF